MRSRNELPDDAAHRARATDLHGSLQDASGRSLALRLWDGTELGPPGAGYRLVLCDPSALRLLRRPPSIGDVEDAYARGDVDVEGDIVAALHDVAEGEDTLGSWGRLVRTARRLDPPWAAGLAASRTLRRGPGKATLGDRRVLPFRDDLPHEFYASFLDPELVHSCAYFIDDDEGLPTAQARKLDLVARKLRLEPGMRLLDVGCGWGSLLVHAARYYGVHGVGVTLSEVQAEQGSHRIHAAGVADRVEVRRAHYRDLDEPFDAVVSIGMAHHRGPSHLSGYLRRVRGLLEPGGLVLCHRMVSGQPASSRSGRARPIPGGEVTAEAGTVPTWRAVREVERASFGLLDVEQLRPSYALTLRSWVANLEAHHEDAVAVAGEHPYRVWRAHMGGTAALLERGRIGVVEILAGREARSPLARHWRLLRLPTAPSPAPAA
ncbi:class I SAM-dependent methyltransferase [Egibacter rhizosphaerae]|uniref:Class I SAM-dependent methyltransferase n=1 Tax=Egibacter rhizosphaerae TaxID=1670831 RepID=A0A411YDH1_9ACTN|nr:cyclopropane-fatty-acyl-phospholipid synthase family protein [Egibacter rhizosphaerae]QBI19255.1 class I SAM-dependent methyltransferase [Egibacter rhizosphaerae]